MGDRTWVQLTIRREDVAAVNRILGIADDDRGKIGSDYTEHWVPVDPGHDCLVYTEFYEVNYGNLPEEAELQQAGIPYDKEWGQGAEYGPGIQYCRYTPEGELAVIDVYDSSLNPGIDALLQRIDEPDKLRQFILDHHAKNTPLPWDDQETNSKRFRARQLIAPKEPA